MVRQLGVVPLPDESLKLDVHGGTCRNAGQQPSESQYIIPRIRAQFHLMTDQPDELEVSAPGFAKPAKNSPVSIRLEILSNYVQRPLCHSSSCQLPVASY